LAIILAGAAVVREREHGTMYHLLPMPLTPFEIAMSKIWANALVITAAVRLSLSIVVRFMLGIPIAGSVPLFMCGVMIYLFFATAIGIFLATIARTMPQLGLLFILVTGAAQPALGNEHAAREYAAVAAHHHGSLAVDPFRVLRAGDPLPRGGFRCGLASIRGRGGDGGAVPDPRTAALSLDCRPAELSVRHAPRRRRAPCVEPQPTRKAAQ
jgi:hypothetical protein